MAHESEVNNEAATSDAKRPSAAACSAASRVHDCWWCDDPIAENDDFSELPGGRGYAHQGCAEEFYLVESVD